MKHVSKKLQEKKTKWRKILKALNLVYVILAMGSRWAIKLLKNSLFLVK